MIAKGRLPATASEQERERDEREQRGPEVEAVEDRKAVEEKRADPDEERDRPEAAAATACRRPQQREQHDRRGAQRPDPQPEAGLVAVAARRGHEKGGDRRRRGIRLGDAGRGETPEGV